MRCRANLLLDPLVPRAGVANIANVLTGVRMVLVPGVPGRRCSSATATKPLGG